VGAADGGAGDIIEGEVALLWLQYGCIPGGYTLLLRREVQGLRLG
jgi:hypothetical protein